jgi:hypothetical protein
VSRIEVQLHHFGVAENGHETPLDSAAGVPSAHSLRPGNVWFFPGGTLDLGLDRNFDGALQSPWLDKPPSLAIEKGYSDKFTERVGREFFQQRVHLDLPSPITEGLLLLAVSRKLDVGLVTVTTARGRAGSPK